MKLISVKFKNFRLLKDLDLDFATGKGKNLTVIRAENESGKTTILNGVQWALYGDDIFSNNLDNQEARLSPIDWNIEENGANVEVSVEVEFSTNAIADSSGKREEVRYKIIRRVEEEQDIERAGRNFKRKNERVILHKLKPNIGWEELTEAESRIKEELPNELREVFFTDGDRALSFIGLNERSGTTGKRERVKSAIRSLLDLEVIENAIKKIEKNVRRARKEFAAEVSDSDLTKLIMEIEKLKEEIEKIGQEHKRLINSRNDLMDKIKDLEEKIIRIAKKGGGGKKKLAQELERIKEAITKNKEEELDLYRKYSDLFRDVDLVQDLLYPQIKKGLSELKKMRDEGKLPKMSIPILTEILDAKVCLCGEPVDKKRKKTLQQKIKESKESDIVQESLTELFYGFKDMDVSQNNQTPWVNKCMNLMSLKDEVEQKREQLNRRRNEIEKQIQKADDTDIDEISRLKDVYKQQLRECERSIYELEMKINDRLLERRGKEEEHKETEKEYKKQGRAHSYSIATQDIQTVIENVKRRIEDKEINEVSKHMNKIFLKMIGTDREQNEQAVIKSVEITNEYDIVVYGEKERQLDPDNDLNGASRRALTLAFIFSLSKVSGVEAPNIIDTPLGMMSGYVKRSVLSTSLKESNQLILFLTRSEISGCEDIIGSKAGKVVTLSNTSHFPAILKNNPPFEDSRIIKCNCGYEGECSLCARNTSELES